MGFDKRWAWAIPTFNGALLVQTIHTIPKGDRLLVIDNSITGWSLSKSWNYAIQRLCVEEGFETVLLANDDIDVRPDTAELLYEALMRKQYEEDRPEKDRMVLILSGYNLRDQQDFGFRWGTGPDFSLVMTSAKLHELVGLFDENYLHAYGEDNDMHHRINVSGYSALSYAPYFHHGSKTINSDPVLQAAFPPIFRRNMAYHEAKWGGPPGKEIWDVPFNGNTFEEQKWQQS